LNTLDSALHAGFGFRTQAFDVGYSYMPSTYLNSIQRISFGYCFKIDLLKYFL